MTTALIVWSPRDFLTFEERTLIRGAAQCGTRGYAFIVEIVTFASFRSMGVPATVIQETLDTAYSQSRISHERFYRVRF